MNIINPFKKKEQPPEMAFPLFAVIPPSLPGGDATAIIQSGLTLRDYFAASYVAAVSSMIYNDATFTEVATDAYRLADAMMKARKETNENA